MNLSVLSPWAALAVFLFTLLTELFLADLLKRWPRLLSKHKTEYARLDEVNKEIVQCRIKSNQLNTPAFFTQYSRVQRQLIKLTKEQERLVALLHPTYPLFTTAWVRQQLFSRLFPTFVKLSLFLVIAFLLGSQTPVFDLSADPFVPSLSHTHSLLSFVSPVLLIILRPLRWITGPTGVLVWMVLCQRVVTRSISPHFKSK